MFMFVQLDFGAYDLTGGMLYIDTFIESKAIELIYFILNDDLCTELKHIDSGCEHLTFTVTNYPSCVGVRCYLLDAIQLYCTETWSIIGSDREIEFDFSLSMKSMHIFK